MFSEYASRFLAQSQSRIISDNERDRDRDRRSSSSRSSRSRTHDRTSSSRNPTASRSYLHRAIGNPYQPTSSQASHLPFASRTGTQQAPLFHSATAEQFRQEDEEDHEHEHEQEIADFYALQRSRRHFQGRQLQESSEADDNQRSSEISHHADDAERSSHRDYAPSRTEGVKSSWKPKGKQSRNRSLPREGEPEESQEDDDQNTTDNSDRGKGKMVDVRLADSVRSGISGVSSDNEPPDFGEADSPVSPDFRKELRRDRDDHVDDRSPFLGGEIDDQTLLAHPRRSSSAESVPPSMTYEGALPPQHDAFWGSLFLISLAGLFATAFLVYLHTSPPSGKPNLGDTIYSTLHASFFLLATYTVVSVLVSLLWIALLRSYVRELVYAMIVAVPVILYSFSLYPFISSFKGASHGSTIQDKVMRWGSIVPAIMATVWIYSVVKGRHAMGKAVNILEFSCRILAVNPMLLAVGFVTLAIIACWTWLWILMFTRVFLGGHLSGKGMFIINASSWWLGVYFILVYLWSLGVIAGIQRTTTAATVSQWYFHRNADPAPSSHRIVHAAIVHSSTTLFGTICLSTLLALLMRLPLMILPRRLSQLLSLAAFSIIPAPIAALTNPLCLTYGAVHSIPLGASAQCLSQLTFLIPSSTVTSLHPRTFSATNTRESSLVPYRLSKLILHATRFMMSLALGFGGWVSTAHNLQLSNTLRGSLYAYVVGLIAGSMGWGVLGAMEGVLAGVVDASVICWASEVGSTRREATYCREAGWLFGGGMNGGRRHEFDV